MISPKCDRCGNELMQPGALVFGPPSATSLSYKQHVCVECYGGLLDYLAGSELAEPSE